jgi:hypothetical protein
MATFSAAFDSSFCFPDRAFKPWGSKFLVFAAETGG